MIEKKITDYLEGFIYDDYSIRIESKSNGNKIFISTYEIDNLLEYFFYFVLCPLMGGIDGD